MLVFQIAVLGDNLLLATLPSSEQLSNAGFAAQPLARQIPATLYLMRVDERMRIKSLCDVPASGPMAPDAPPLNPGAGSIKFDYASCG